MLCQKKTKLNDAQPSTIGVAFKQPSKLIQNHNTHDKQTNVYAHEMPIAQGNVVTFQLGPLDSPGRVKASPWSTYFKKNIKILCDAI